MPGQDALSGRGLRRLLGCLALSWSAACGSAAQAGEPEARLVFAGDIMLSREVAHEAAARQQSAPWRTLARYFRSADWAMGNFEGSIGDAEDCASPSAELCFATSAEMAQLMKEAGFSAAGVENNHSADTGEEGRRNTAAELAKAGIRAVSFARSPGFFRAGNRTFAVIAFTTIAGRDGRRVELPSRELRQKLRLARGLADWVIVFVHWGSELQDWPHPRQRAMANWLTKNGADIIIGAHPHVVQQPECINGRPVFFSLGNFIFDQKYPATKAGMVADCAVADGVLTCKGAATHIPSNSAFPARIEARETDALRACRVAPGERLTVDGYVLGPRLDHHGYVDGDIVLEGRRRGDRPWAVAARRVLSLESATFAAPDGRWAFLFALEKHPSSLDREDGPRPYVYQVTPHGLVAKWRGSALAWPLVDAVLRRRDDGTSFVCALHRKDSFVMLDPSSTKTRIAAYDWNGFGFSGIAAPADIAACRQAFE